MNLSPAYLKQREQWKLEGKQEGRQEGRQEAKDLEIKLLLRQLKRCLGVLSSENEIKIQALSFEQLEDLGEALFDFNEESDLANWLDNN